MPENHDVPLGAGLPVGDPALEAVSAVHALSQGAAPAPTPELAAFLASPELSDVTGHKLETGSQTMKIVHVRLSKASRAAVAATAAVGLAVLGTTAVAAAVGQGPGVGLVQKVVGDEPVSTTQTSTATQSQTDDADDQDEATSQDDATETDATETDDATETGDATDAATQTPNPQAFANHHDGVGADDEHADVRGGGSVDHHTKAPSTTPTGGSEDDEGDADDQGGQSTAGHGGH
jgi:hypothetical protein